MTVSWTAPEGAERYQVERRTGHAGSSGLVQIDTNSTATTYLDTDTAYHTHYRYRVRAGNNAGYGALVGRGRNHHRPRAGNSSRARRICPQPNTRPAPSQSPGAPLRATRQSTATGSTDATSRAAMRPW